MMKILKKVYAGRNYTNVKLVHLKHLVSQAENISISVKNVVKLSLVERTLKGTGKQRLY